nr:ABC-three component system protein [uncultured Flavobacterium sp.]
MTREEKYLGRIMLKNRFYETDKQSYEDLFTKIMQNQDSNFKQIKPQGSLGDGKCDGFNIKTGEYYQVYAPEELTGNEATLLSKMDASISGLLDFWKEKGFDVKKFNYVVKDNYRNVYALIYTNAEVIAKKYNIKCEVMTCKDVEDIFMGLNDEDIFDVIGGIIPDPLNIENVEYDILNEVIGFLLKSEVPKISENIPSQPDFDEKIVFNSLSKITSDFLNAGQRQSFVIKDYFELNSKFLKEELRQIFNNIYREALLEIPDSETKNDEIFQYILDKSSPRNNFACYNAVYILMAYYFEYCDIFETPIIN